MKKSAILVVFALAWSSLFASYTFTQTFFDDYNPSTEGNFSHKNDGFRDDAKIQRYSQSFSPDDSSNYNCAFDASGQIRCGDYQIKKPNIKGNGVSREITRHYKKLKDIKDVKGVSRGDDFNCALDNDDDVYCWGSNKRGQLGSDTDKKSSPNPMKVDIGIHFKKVYTKAHYACALDKQGSAYCWGDGINGEVGNGEKGRFTTPQKVKTDVKFSRLSMARTYTCGIAEKTREIYCWGKSKKGSKKLDSSIPVKM